MTKKELIETIASQTGVSVKDTTIVVENLISTIKDSVESGKQIFIRGFGSFGMKEKSARKGRDIRKNAIVDIPARKVPFFKVSKNFFD